MAETSPSLSRRTVLRTVGTAIAASVGTAGSASAVPYCTIAETTTAAYIDCPGKRHLAYVEEGAIGHVMARCTDDSGNEWAEIRWNCEETWTVSTDDITTTTGCYC